MSRLKTWMDSDTARRVAFGAVVVLFIALFVFASLQDPADEEPEPRPTSTVKVMRPTEPGSADDHTDEDGGAEVEEPVEPVQQPTTDLSLEEQDAALTTATDGFLAWYDYSPEESTEDRRARLSGYLTTEALNTMLAPDGMTPEDETYTRASLNWTEAISADSSQVRVLVGARTSGQIGSEFFGGSAEDQMVISSDTAYLVVLTPEDGSWRISSISEQK